MLNIDSKISLLPIEHYASKPVCYFTFAFYTNNAPFIGSQTAKF